MLKGREIVIGVSGGIAAYKSAALVSLLVQQGAQVTAVLTRNAKRFIGAATFAALTGRPVAMQSFDPGRYPLGAHIELAAQADLVIVAPATADFLAKAAAGMADDLLTTLYLCAQSPVPGTGWLSCRQHGAGRMAEPEEIATVIRQLLSAHSANPSSHS